MRKSLLFILLFILLLLITLGLHAQAKLNWWKEAKFGLFIHWGLYSATQLEWNGHPAKGNEHMMFGERIPLKEYAKIADTFNPKLFDAETWIKDARDAGMKYIVITAKHHEGYAMYNSLISNYNIVKTTPFKRDPIKELAAACNKYNMKLGFYYSLGRDWEDPDAATPNGNKSNTWDYPDEAHKDFDKYFHRKVIPQITELLSNYGPVAVLWFDTPEGTTPEESRELRALINRLQPDCIINSRISNNQGDYEVREQKIGNVLINTPWESCITMSGKWGYSKYDNAWKSPELLVRQLIEIVSKGGNLLLNVGPTNLGIFPPQARENLHGIGDWMKINGEAIYGTRPWHTISEYASSGVDSVSTAEGKSANDYTDKTIRPDIYFTAKGQYVYLFARSWHFSQINSRSLGKLSIKSITCLSSTEKIEWCIKDDQLIIQMPEQLLSKPNSIPIYVFKIHIQ